MAKSVFLYQSFSGHALLKQVRPFGEEAFCSFEWADGWELSADIRQSPPLREKAACLHVYHRPGNRVTNIKQWSPFCSRVYNLGKTRQGLLLLFYLVWVIVTHLRLEDALSRWLTHIASQLVWLMGWEFSQSSQPGAFVLFTWASPWAVWVS